MGKAFTISFFISFCLGAVAQDLVVTREGDSINCKILSVEDAMFRYSFLTPQGNVLQTEIPAGLVASYEKRYYTKQTRATLYPGLDQMKNFRVTISGGPALRTAKINPDIPSHMEDYMEQLRRGVHLGIDASLYLGYVSGLGLQYYRFSSSNSQENTLLGTYGGQTYYGDVSDHIVITYVGPSYVVRMMNADGRHNISGSVGLGYLGYVDEGEFEMEAVINGRTLGIAYVLAYDYVIAENVALGFQFSGIQGNLTEYDLSFGGRHETVELDRENIESLHHIDISFRLTLLF